MQKHNSAAASGWAGWALAQPEFGSSVNPFPTRGANYAHHNTACPPGLENLTASLYDIIILLIALVREQGGIELLVYKVKLINEQDSKEIFLRMNEQACLFIQYVKSTLQ